MCTSPMMNTSVHMAKRPAHVCGSLSDPTSPALSSPPLAWSCAGLYSNPTPYKLPVLLTALRGAAGAGSILECPRQAQTSGHGSEGPELGWEGRQPLRSATGFAK